MGQVILSLSLFIKMNIDVINRNTNVISERYHKLYSEDPVSF